MKEEKKKINAHRSQNTALFYIYFIQIHKMSLKHLALFYLYPQVKRSQILKFIMKTI